MLAAVYWRWSSAELRDAVEAIVAYSFNNLDLVYVAMTEGCTAQQ